MNKKSIIANGVYLDDVKDLLRTGQRMAISTSTFEKIIDSLEEKFQECESLKEQNETFHKMLNAPEVRVALTDVRTGEREVQAKIRRRLEKENVNYKQALEEIESYCTHYLMHNPCSPAIDLNIILNIIIKVK